MRDRLRSFDSKITFFAFADIITAVSGMLIFITLLLATDLGRPTAESQSADTEIERQIEDTLAQQLRLDERNRALSELLAQADTAPDSGKLRADIEKLRSELADEKSKHASLAARLAESAAGLAERDKTLGLTDMKATIQQTIQEADALLRQGAKVRNGMASLDQRVSGLENLLLKLKLRDGQLWLIPEKSTTTKEPILMTLAKSGLIAERFDHPEQRKEWSESDARSGVREYLKNARPTDQYVVFLVRPSGIELFQRVSDTVRGMGFEIGFDALEENRTIHFSSPPPIDEPAHSEPRTAATVPGNGSTTNGIPVSSTKAVPATQPTSPSQTPVTAVPVAPPRPESWWQRFLRWLGFK